MTERMSTVLSVGAWAFCDIPMKDPLDVRFRSTVQRINRTLNYSILAIEVGGFLLTFINKAAKQTTCADTLNYHLAGPDCNYSCVLIDPEPLNASLLNASNASLLNVSSI